MQACELNKCQFSSAQICNSNFVSHFWQCAACRNQGNGAMDMMFFSNCKYFYRSVLFKMDSLENNSFVKREQVRTMCFFCLFETKFFFLNDLQGTCHGFWTLQGTPPEMRCSLLRNLWPFSSLPVKDMRAFLARMWELGCRHHNLDSALNPESNLFQDCTFTTEMRYKHILLLVLI